MSYDYCFFFVSACMEALTAVYYCRLAPSPVLARSKPQSSNASASRDAINYGSCVCANSKSAR